MILSINKIARITSVITHPLLAPLYLFCIFAFSDLYFMLLLPQKVLLTMYFLIILITIVLPIVFMYLLKLRKKPTSIESSNDNTLRLSNLINAVFYYLLFYLMKTADIIPIYYLYILSLVLVNVFVFAISLNYNISLYMVYAGSLVGYIAGLCLFFHYRLIYVLIGIVIFSGFAASSRLILGKHKPSEVYSGFLLGVGLLLLVLVLIPR